MSTVLYRYSTADDRRRAVLSTLYQSGAWISWAMVADRHRYTSLTAGELDAALDELQARGSVERSTAHPSGRTIYRYVFAR